MAWGRGGGERFSKICNPWTKEKKLYKNLAKKSANSAVLKNGIHGFYFKQGKFAEVVQKKMTKLKSRQNILGEKILSLSPQVKWSAF